MTKEAKIRTCLWFHGDALPAAETYCRLIPDSRIERVSRYPEGQGMAEPGGVLLVEFTLGGTPYQALNADPVFTLSEAVSIVVATEDQAETDRLWSALIADGGQESHCGWLKDRFGLSWQIVPKRLSELMGSADAAKVWPALMQMGRIEIDRLEAAVAA